VPSDADLVGLVDAVRAGIHDPATMPFDSGWTDAESPELERGALQYWWKGRGLFSPTAWDLTFAVILDGEVIGAQNLTAADFPALRQAETGSWLTMAHHGKGIGKEMRRAVLHFAFSALEAEAVTSAAFADNPASQGVSLAVGYEPNGRSIGARRGEAGEQVRFRITKQRWLDTRTDLSVDVHGFEACRDMFGLEA